MRSAPYSPPGKCLPSLAIVLFLSLFVFGQNSTPPPADDNNWSGFVSSTFGPLFNGPDVSFMAANGEVFIAGRLGSSVKVARWDGASWTVLGDRLQRSGSSTTAVSDIVALANGDVYLSGNFNIAFNTGGGVEITTNIAHWEAATQSWKPVGQGTDVQVSRMAADEANQILYVIGPETANNFDGTSVAIHKVGLWDIAQQRWGAVGQGLGSVDFPMSILADGSGNLFMGGVFTEVRDGNGTPVTVNSMARWDGLNWHAMGQGLSSANQSYPSTLALDSNNNLFVAGRFDLAVNSDGSSVAGPAVFWDGTLWHGTSHPPAFTVDKVVADGRGKVYSLYGDPATFRPNVLEWDGSQWSNLAQPLGEVVTTLAGNPGFPNTRVYLGGLYGAIITNSGTQVNINNNALWDGTFWTPMIDRIGTNGIISAFASHRFNSILYAGGNFSRIGYTDAGNIARFNGVAWDSINGGVNGLVHGLSADYGYGVVVGGEFSEAKNSNGSTVAALNVVYLDNRDQWRTLGGGTNGPVYAVLNRSTRFSGGYLGEIVVGGNFTTVYNPDGTAVPANSLAIWNWLNETWRPVGGQLTGTNIQVRTIVADSRSYFLNFFAGGQFDGAVNPDGSTVASANVIMWKEVGEPDQWVPFGRGIDGMVYSLAYDDNLNYRTTYGYRVWVGGDFQNSLNSDGTTSSTPYLSLWDITNSAWRPLAGGTDGIVRAITPIRSLPYQGAFVGGDFTRGIYANGNSRTINHVGLFRLEPTRFNLRPLWNERGSNAINGTVHALRSFDPCIGNGEIVYAGGTFSRAGYVPVGNLAKWRYRWNYGVTVFAGGVSRRSSGSRNAARGVMVTTGCNYLNRKNNPLPNGVLFDSLAFGESVLVDSISRFNPSAFYLYDVDDPNFPVFFDDSLLIGTAAPLTMAITGVYDTTLYAPNPEGRSIALRPRFFEAPMDTGQPGMVTLQFLNLITDAPALDIQIDGGPILASGIPFGEQSPGTVLAPGNYTMVVRQSSSGDVIATTAIDLRGNADEIVVLPLIGFVDPAANQNGPAATIAVVETGQPAVGIGDNTSSEILARDFTLGHNFPNPFNPETTISLEIGALVGAQSAVSSLKIYDMLGREVKTLFERRLAPGTHQVKWDGTDAGGTPVASGVYLYRLQVGNKVAQTRKMMLVR